MGVKTGIYTALYDPAAANWGARKFAIWIRHARLTALDEYIARTTLHSRDPSLIDDAVVTRPRPAITRHRYPGAPGIGVKAGTRQVVVGPSATRLTLPGRPITLECPKDGSPYDPNNAGAKMKVLQLTLEGSFPDFYTYCETAVAKSFLLRTNQGRPIFVKKA